MLSLGGVLNEYFIWPLSGIEPVNSLILFRFLRKQKNDLTGIEPKSLKLFSLKRFKICRLEGIHFEPVYIRLFKIGPIYNQKSIILDRMFFCLVYRTVA